MKNHAPSRKSPSTPLFLVFLLLATSLSGCAALGTGLDLVTDPDLFELLQNLRNLINKYELALENPSLELAERADLEVRYTELCQQAHEELDRLAALGYDDLAKECRKELPEQWLSSNSEPSSSELEAL